MSKSNIFIQIRKTVAKIPKGKVATYGQIARLVGHSDARVVGWALCNNMDPDIPCHRVIKKDGYLVESYSFGGWRKCKRKLHSEGITFIGTKQVDMEKHEWSPRV